MERKYLYLAPFKPDTFKTKPAMAALNDEEGVQASFFKKNYPGVRVEADHQLSDAWITGVLSQFGEAGAVQEYTYTSETADLPSRPLTDQEAAGLDKRLRKNITSGNLFGIFGLGVLGFGCLIAGITNLSIICLILAVPILIGWGFSIKHHLRDKKEAAEMQFNRDDWTAIDCFCCNSWTTEEVVQTEDANGNPTTEKQTSYHHELGAGQFAYNHHYSGAMNIGGTRTIFYNKVTGAEA